MRAAGWLTGLAALVLSISAAISLGAVAIPLGTVWGVLLDRAAPGLIEPGWSAGRAAIVWDIRLPRALLAALVGAGLALVGAVLQSVTRNPLADPHLLGISSGGAFGAILALLHTGMFLGPATVPTMAFLGALAATGIVLTLASFANATSADRLVLTGVAVSFIVMSLANALIFLGDPRAAHTVVFWMLGGLGLGPGLFYNSPMEACVIVCRSRKPAERQGRILFIDAVAEVARERAQSFLRDAHQARILAAYQAFEEEPGLSVVVSTADVLAAEGNLSIARYVKKPKPAVSEGDAVTLAAAWGAFDAEGREFWTGMDALVDMLDGLAPAEDADA